MTMTASLNIDDTPHAPGEDVSLYTMDSGSAPVNTFSTRELCPVSSMLSMFNDPNV